MLLDKTLLIPDLGPVGADSGFHLLTQTEDGRFIAGQNGVEFVVATGDGKVEFVSFGTHTLACVKSAIAYPVYYPVAPVQTEYPLSAVLMDLDGTTVRSEDFWIWIIQMSTASMLGDPNFELEEADLSFVSGHSVSEHLQYCIDKYCPGASLEKARGYYFEHTHREMEEIMVKWVDAWSKSQSTQFGQELHPITGRTHQLRLHCCHMGFPILGDPQYNSPESAEESGKLGLNHQLLCAKRLELDHPITGQPLTLESRMDVAFKL